MKRSARSKRHARHQKRGAMAGLNLVSLMDIFTILVFFLLINSGDVEVLQTDDTLELPSSQSELVPEETVVVRINQSNILISGQAIVDIDNISLDDNGNISALSDELKYLASRKTELSEREQKEGLAITIMGDKETPYSLLKLVIKTCASENYRDVALAVNQIATPSANELEPSDAPALDNTTALGAPEK